MITDRYIYNTIGDISSASTKPYGGEEFIIILPETDLKKAIQIAKNMRRLVNNLKFKLRKKHHTVKITCSFCISTFTDEISNTTDVFNVTDEALYQAKENGRDGIVSFSENKCTHIDNKKIGGQGKVLS